jgi:hypothetical protein
VRLQVTPLVVRRQRHNLELSAAPQHQELHKLSLGDKSTADRGHPPSMAHKAVDRSAVWPCRLRSWLWTKGARAAQPAFATGND